MSLTREEKLSIYKKIHPELLIETLDALQHLAQKKSKPVSLESLITDNPNLHKAYQRHIKLTDILVKDATKKQDSVQETIQFYVLWVTIGVGYSDLNILRLFLKCNIDQSNVNEFNDSMQLIHENKEFPTSQTYEFSEDEKMSSTKHLLHAFDIFMHTNQKQLEKYSVCENISKINLALVKNELKTIIPFLEKKQPQKNPHKYPFFTGKKFVMSMEEEKRYPQQLVKHAKESKDPLFKAIANGESLEKIKNLIADHPGCLLSKDEDQNTPFHLAVSAGRTDILSLLTRCDINAANCHGFTAMHLAIQGGVDGVISALLNLGADFNMSIPSSVDYINKLRQGW